MIGARPHPDILSEENNQGIDAAANERNGDWPRVALEPDVVGPGRSLEERAFVSCAIPLGAEEHLALHWTSEPSDDCGRNWRWWPTRREERVGKSHSSFVETDANSAEVESEAVVIEDGAGAQSRVENTEGAVGQRAIVRGGWNSGMASETEDA